MAVGTINNSTAFSVYTNYSASALKLEKSMGRLSSGTKSVVDDGAGVGLSERMRSQAGSTAMARQNVDNAISVLQTADGWMQEVSDTLARMHELAIESNDATKTNTDRTNINAEFTQLQQEVTRIVNTAAKFNGTNLLNGSMSAATQVGADSGQTITLKIDSLASVTQMISAATNGVATASAATSQITKLQTQIDNVSKARASVGGLQSRFEHTRSGQLTYEDNIRAAESKIRDVDMV
ncbi:MAG: flagellin, partial [Lentisphaeria bacterium]|nr:flagellin [Lentisphaeria bacterium]